MKYQDSDIILFKKMHLKEIGAYNQTVTRRRKIFPSINKTIEVESNILFVYGITSDNSFVIIREISYLTRFGTPGEITRGAEIIANIKDNKITLLTDEQYRCFKQEGILSSIDIKDLNMTTYDRLAQEFDMSEIPTGPTYHLSNFIENLFV